MSNRLFKIFFQKTAGRFLIVSGFFCLFAFSFSIVHSQTADDLKNSLKSQIDAINQQIADCRGTIKDLQTQSKSLKQQISLFDAKIKAAQLEIRQTNLAIIQTQQEINNKNVGISDVQAKLDREKELLGEHLRLQYEYDQQGLVDIILSNQKLSDAFDELSSFETLQANIQDSMAQISQFRDSLEAAKTALENKKDDLNQLKVLQQIQQQGLTARQNDEKNLLAQTKGKESNYQAIMSKAQADVNAIKSQLYLLEGVGVSMPLYNAYQYAKKAGDLTGVRPAFLLAILKVETSWGEKVGTGTWRRDMSARDQAAFVQICDELGRDPDKMPVSRKSSYGWGGAMGPAQFLPSVWLAYKDQIARLTGDNPPDPWDIEDSFVAAAIKLAQNGANVRTDNTEWKAAQIYFAGSRWNNPTYYFYGDQVMDMAAVIQGQLDIITK